MERKKSIAYSIVVIGAVILMLIFARMNASVESLEPLSEGYFVLLAVVLIAEFFAVVYALIVRGDERNLRKANDKKILDSCAVMEGNTLRIHYLTTSVLSNLSVEDAMNASIKYEPEKLHIGAVSVGGVVSGGAYTTGGYNYISNFSKSGRCLLKFHDDTTVFHIILPPAILEKAKTSSIKQYIDDKGQVNVTYGYQYTKAELSQLFSEARTNGFSNLVNKDAPTYEQCKEIIDFLYANCDDSALSSIYETSASTILSNIKIYSGDETDIMDFLRTKGAIDLGYFESKWKRMEYYDALTWFRSKYEGEYTNFCSKRFPIRTLADLEALKKKDAISYEDYVLGKYELTKNNSGNEAFVIIEGYDEEYIDMFLASKGLASFEEQKREPAINKETGEPKLNKNGKIIPRGAMGAMSWFKRTYHDEYLDYLKKTIEISSLEDLEKLKGKGMITREGYIIKQYELTHS